KLTLSQGGSNDFSMSGGIMTGRHMTTGRLASLLSGILRRPVHDETGLDGTYDFMLDPKPYAGEGGPQDAASLILTAFKDELGLQFEARKFDLQVMVVDYIERVPTEN